jgi:peptidyl-tRNA hydrolase
MRGIVDLSITYVYIIDSGLGMRKGKISSQVSHVAMKLARKYSVLGKAIILKAQSEDFKKFIDMIDHGEIDGEYIEDAGLTEVAPGTITCLGFRATDETKELTKDLKLL